MGALTTNSEWSIGRWEEQKKPGRKSTRARGSGLSVLKRSSPLSQARFHNFDFPDATDQTPFNPDAAFLPWPQPCSEEWNCDKHMLRRSWLHGNAIAGSF